MHDDDASVATAALEERGGLDVLVNDAGVTGGGVQTPSEVDLDAVRTAVEVDVLGVIRLTNAVLPLMRRSSSPRIVDVSSTVGSLTEQYADELEDTGILVTTGCPGFVATDLDGFRGTRTPEQGAATQIRLATLPDGGPTGTCSDDDGPIPW